jgi:radical SAM protein with 4Fe4S-binding SPASM domain
MPKTKRKAETVNASASRMLVQLVLEVTYKCDHDCIFCYNCWKHEYPVEREMTPAEFGEVLEKMPRSAQISLSGGEPLLRKDIVEIAKAAKQRTGRVTLLTTGELLTPKLADELTKFGVFLQIPLHGTEKNHDRMTRRKGSYRKALDAMALLSEKRIPFGTSTVVCRDNIDEFQTILQIVAAMGARESIAIRFLPGGEGLKHTELMMDRKQTIRMMDCLEDASHKYGLRCAIGAPNLPCVIDEKPYKRMNFGGCGAGMEWFTVDPSGRLRICNHSPTILGDLRKQELGAILKHPLLDKLRNLELVPQKCGGCGHREICRGGCRAVAETLYNDMSAPDPLFGAK